MCTTLLSINPKHVDNILNGIKKYEYRRVRPKREVSKIVIYSTYPVMEVVAEVQVVNTLEYSPSNLWKNTKQFAGISHSFFRSYFSGKKKAIAFEIGEIIKYDKPKSLSDFGVNAAPQSFIYLSE